MIAERELMIDIQENYLKISSNLFTDVIQYEIDMINNNQMSGFLPIELEQFNQEITLLYDIRSKIQLMKFLNNKKLSRSEFITVLKNMCKVIIDSKIYFLNDKKIFLDLNYIFISNRDLSLFVPYIPVNEKMYDRIDNQLKGNVIRIINNYVKFEYVKNDNLIQQISSYLLKDTFQVEGFYDYLEELNVDTRVTDFNAINDDLLQMSNMKNEDFNNVSEENKNKKIRITFLVFQLIALGLFFIVNQVFDLTLTLSAVLFFFILSVDCLFFIVINSIINNKKLNLKIPKVKISNNMRKAEPVTSSSLNMFKREIVPDENFETVMLEVNQPHLLHKKGGFAEKVYINKDEFKIGRLQTMADFVCDNKAIGKIHAVIVNKNSQYYIIDLQSKNGTYINGQKIQSNIQYELKDNDSITLADSEFVFKIS